MPKKTVKGFTLIELLVIVAIIGILSTIGVVAYSKYTKIAQISAIKAQNNEIYNFIKIETSTQCINYSDVMKLKFKQNNQDKTLTAPCNSSHNMYNGAWDVVSKMFGVFKYYFQMNPDVRFKNPVSSEVKNRNSQGYNPSCPTLVDAKNMLPGETCITYEGLGSRPVSGNACSNKGFNTWLLVVSKLPDDEFYFNCAGKVW